MGVYILVQATDFNLFQRISYLRDRNMETLKNYCSVCLRETNHTELFRKRVENDEKAEEYIIRWIDEYLVVECQGCNNVSFRKEYWDETMMDPETGEWGTDITIYPLVLKNRNQLGNTHSLPDQPIENQLML